MKFFAWFEKRDKLIVFNVIAVVLAITSNCTANADYAPAFCPENYEVVSADWKLVQESVPGQDKAIWKIECRYNNQKHSWPIKLIWLASRIDSNSICGGTWQKLANSYLRGLQALRDTPVAIEVKSEEPKGPLKVAAIWSLGRVPKYDTYFCTLRPVTAARKKQLLRSTSAQFELIGIR